MREALQQVRRAALGHARLAAQDEVLVQTPGVAAGCGKRERDPRVCPQVPELALITQGPDDDLVPVEAHPGHRDVRVPLPVERDNVGERAAFEEPADGVGQVGHDHMVREHQPPLRGAIG